MVCSHWVDLHGDSPRVVDPIQKNVKLVILDIFVDCLASTLPVAVVVDDQNTSDREFGIQMDQLVPRRLVPVGIES